MHVAGRSIYVVGTADYFIVTRIGLITGGIFDFDFCLEENVVRFLFLYWRFLEIRDIEHKKSDFV